MSLTPQSDEGVVILCDARGIVETVVRDELGVSGRVPPGASIVQLADGANAEKAANFLRALQNLLAAFDWEINVPCPEGLAPLHFTGGPAGDGLLVVAARTLDGVARLSDGLTRSPAKELGPRSSRHTQPDNGMYDELTRVNNDLSNLQRELFRKNVELAAINAQKNQFIGMAAHDLRSPLSVILNYSEFLEVEAGPELNQEHREFVRTIKQMSEFMLRLINDLLDVAQLESGKLNLDLQPEDLTEVVRQNVGLNRVLAAKKQIRMVFHPGAPLPAIRIDRGKIEQVLNNLLTNAIKFSHVGTEVSIDLTREARHAVITITDQGQGIPADDLAKLFKPFSRTRVKSTDGESSTGLGLSIVRRIVEGHGGTVGVESQVGKGTSFQVRLPWDRAAARIA